MKKTALIIWLGLSSPVLGDDWDDLITNLDFLGHDQHN